ncbi:hypothetical protein AAG570_003406 [Ranatra chinensis]|uniref:Uncharacterized protein n=1 Tax=Ranatra chinensis TaxID=642074 RepID=A0ABD0Y3L1_9HEMI
MAINRNRFGPTKSEPETTDHVPRVNRLLLQVYRSQPVSETVVMRVAMSTPSLTRATGRNRRVAEVEGMAALVEWSLPAGFGLTLYRSVHKEGQLPRWTRHADADTALPAFNRATECRVMACHHALTIGILNPYPLSVKKVPEKSVFGIEVSPFQSSVGIPRYSPVKKHTEVLNLICERDGDVVEVYRRTSLTAECKSYMQKLHED